MLVLKTAQADQMHCLSQARPPTTPCQPQSVGRSELLLNLNVLDTEALDCSFHRTTFDYGGWTFSFKANAGTRFFGPQMDQESV
jgi:hypothetical protein